MIEGDRNTKPDDEWARTVCAIGQGAACCRYLTLGGDGWSCAKHGELRYTLDRRAAAGTMNARSDNCTGRGE